MQNFLFFVLLSLALAQVSHSSFTNGRAWEPWTIKENKDLKKSLKDQRASKIETAESLTKYYHQAKNFDDSPMALPQSPEDLIVIEGFQFCHMYDGSHFRKDAQFFPIVSLDERDHEQAVPTTIGELGKDDFIAFIDVVAEKVLEDIRRERAEDIAFADPESLRRFACYFAVDGKNSYLHFAKMKLLQWVDGKTYFPKIAWPATPKYRYIDDVAAVAPVRRVKLPHYKLAFTILCHENAQAVKYLIDTLFEKSNAGDVVVIVHVDAKAKDFAKEVDRLILREGWGHVHRTKDSHVGAWGGAGLVYGQLSAYFELLDICKFDYVINISAYDFPLMDTDVMYKFVSERSKDVSLFSYLNYEGFAWDWTRLNRVATFQTTKGMKFGDSGDLSPIASRLRVASPRGYSFRTTHQWNVLTYDFVKTLRNDPVAPTLLIQYEWSYLTDEVYFGAYARWNPEMVSFKEYHTRCYRSGSNFRPLSIANKWGSKRFVNKCVKYGRMIGRKYHIDKEPKLVPFLAEMRERSRKLEAKGGFKYDSWFGLPSKFHKFFQTLYDRARKNKHFDSVYKKVWVPLTKKFGKQDESEKKDGWQLLE
eukprot:Partr_v1_DN27721_c2_g2_i2_m66858